MKRYFIIGAVVLSLIGTAFYFQSHISVWGFRVPTNDLKAAIILTENKGYMVTDYNSVLALAKEVSNMERLNKVTSGNFPPQCHPNKYRKLLIQTKNNGTYGGSFWAAEDRFTQDSNGYYWSVNNSLIQLMDKSITGAKMLY